MKYVFFLLAAVVGAVAVLSLIRGIEVLAIGGGFKWENFGIGLIGLLLSALWIKRGRAIKK